MHKQIRSDDCVEALPSQRRLQFMIFYLFFHIILYSKSYQYLKIADLRTNSGAFTSDDLDKADILNQQYANTFTVEDLSSTPNFRPKQLQTQPLETVHITEEMVHKKLQSLRSDKSPGPDKLHPRILKELANELTTPLTIIYNKCIDKGTLPSQWKEAIVTPIFKKGCKSDPSNYRPVSLTSVVCKVMERIISGLTINLSSDVLGI